MDIISHALWGSITFGRKNKKSFWLAFILGMAPDLLSFGVLMVVTLIGNGVKLDFSHGPPDPNLVPGYIHTLYDITHSFITFGVIFLILWAIFKRPIWEFTAWGLHILMDIGTHATSFFPTPFLWPFVKYRVNGIPWSHPIILIPDVIILIILYVWYFLMRPRIRKNKVNTREV
jgi:hypothetical protein